jgi:hypothetical protein
MPRNKKTSSPEESTLLCLLRGEPLGPALGRCRSEELSRLALSQKVVSPLAARIVEEEGIGFDWRRWAASLAVARERDARRYAQAAEKTIGLLSSKGISPIVLKGMSLALGKPRDAGDVDLLIPEASLIQAISTLESNGYEYRGYDRNMFIRRREYRDWKRLSRWSIQFEFQEPDTGALVELHTAFFETGRVYTEDLSALRAAVGEFIASSIVDESTGYRFLSLEDRALLLALHASLKRSPDKRNFVLRNLLDLRALADAGLDWARLEERCMHFGVAYHLFFLLTLYASFADTCAPAQYTADLASRLPPRLVRLARLHMDCLNSMGSYKGSAIFAYRFISPFALHGTPRARLRSLLVLPLLLPRRYELASIYGLPRRSPLTYLCYPLEPVRWVYRLARKALRTMSAL